MVCVGARRPVERRGGTGAVLVRTQEFAVRNVPVSDCYDVVAVVPGDELQYLRTGVLVCPSVCWVGGLLGPACEEPGLL